MNSFQLSGRLVRAPEARGAATVFSLAVDAYNPASKTREAQFFPLTAFGKSGETLQKFGEKGKYIEVWGDLRRNQWTDGDGKKHETTEMIVQGFNFGPSSGGGAAAIHRDEGYASGGFTLGD